jgi:hypothetical protein
MLLLHLLSAFLALPFAPTFSAQVPQNLAVLLTLRQRSTRLPP